MNSGGVVASLVILLVANDNELLDCVCKQIKFAGEQAGRVSVSPGLSEVWSTYCIHRDDYQLYETCDNLDKSSPTLPAVGRLVPTTWDMKPYRYADELKCGFVTEKIRGLTVDAAVQLSRELSCHIAANCINSYSVQGSNDTEWNLTTLETHTLWDPIIWESLEAVQRITRATTARDMCYLRHPINLPELSSKQPGMLTLTKKSKLAPIGSRRVTAPYDVKEYQAVVLEELSNYWRDNAQLLASGVTHVSRLLIPLAFKYLSKNVSNEQLDRWIEDMKHVRDMLHTKLRGWERDVQYIRKQIANYTLEEDKETPGSYILRRPVLSDHLLDFQEWYLSFRDDFSAQCEQQQPKASEMFGLADAVYSFYRINWLRTKYSPSVRDIIDEKWQLEDKSSAVLNVDTDCLQLLADVLEHPTCPLEDLPPEAVRQRLQCRERLWADVVQRAAPVPVTSYLAYTQRANVNLCLLAWMAVNSFGVCQDVPFSIVQSVHDARCYFDSPDDQSCLQSNTTDAICSVSRAVLLLKCREFSFHKSPELCAVRYYGVGLPRSGFEVTWTDPLRGYVKPTERTLSYKESLYSVTLKYKNFKIERLKSLEISFVVLNIVFRLLTAGLYMHLPHLRNLPGKIFLSFQITGIVQILCSEVVYRMAGVPDLSVMVLIDSALTFLSCIWLNSFCYHMYACVRHLRLPNELAPTEASQIFRRQVLYALIPWSTVCATCIALERTDRYYLIYSRIIFLGAISLSISFNLVCLGLVGIMYLRTRNSMQQLKIYRKGKFASKKELVFMSVKTVILSGIGIIIRIGFHQVQGVAQLVYCVHIATMVQGPLLYVFFICNGTTLPILKNRIRACFNPDITIPEQELCSAAERNLARRKKEQAAVAESSL
ncbi:uncharacterized protein LOC126188858 [Schistocerca cancellata]|uniref:uncharacterized protein LOC126188858 n=1 Tax=Schistocerca cancellata TaxID=274614 RepID=UPI00211877F3|nr:uncharacterized protein LOC126188858 [Schistocerca cancellata]